MIKAERMVIRPMSEMAVHYYADPNTGVVYMHFSGSLNKFNSKVIDKNVFTLATDAVKQLPHGKRSWDNDKKIWILDASYFFDRLLPFYQKAPTWFEIIDYPNLNAWRIFIEEIQPEGKKVISASDPDHVKAAGFFNNFNVVVEQAVNTRDDRKTLVELTGVSDFSDIDRADPVALKKLYRATAIKLHPDKNGGDHSRMSTFTQLWGIYVQPRS